MAKLLDQNSDRAATATPHRYRWDREAYHKLTPTFFPEDARVELIEGDIIEMAPIGSRHAGKVERLRRLLEHALRNRALVFTQTPIVLDEFSEPQPDIAVLKPRDNFYEDTHPRSTDVYLLIEVADSSIQYDREVKIPLYAQHGIPEAWLLDLQRNRMEVFSSPEEGEYRHLDYYRKGTIHLKYFPDAAIPLDKLLLTFLEMP